MRAIELVGAVEAMGPAIATSLNVEAHSVVAAKPPRRTFGYTSILIGSVTALHYPVAPLVFRQAFATGALPFGRCANPTAPLVAAVEAVEDIVAFTS